MKGLSNSLKSFTNREDGPTVVEYAVTLALVIVVCVVAITALGTNAKDDQKPDALPPKE